MGIQCFSSTGGAETADQAKCDRDKTPGNHKFPGLHGTPAALKHDGIA